ncbi:MAG: SUMF1/EgtB/PvdO family nonheme iron enzyme [Magnetococcus sp. YQC-5]
MITIDMENLAVDSLILHYRIEQVLGQGGFGITYLALDTQTNEKVAIKEYFPRAVAIRESDGKVRPKSSSEQDVQQFQWGLSRFRQEILTLAKFDHPNIVPVLNFFEILDTVYMVMPFVEGESLKAYLDKNPGLSEQALLDVALPVLDGLDVMHRAGYLHRDIKPDNILMRHDGRPMLLDFGATRQAMGAQCHAMTVVFTPGYAPIEQSYQDSKRQGPWTDIFSMGAVLYFAIAGKRPSPATARIVAISSREQDPLPSLLQLGKGKYQEHFLLAIEHAMAMLEKDRPQTVAEWKRELLGQDEVSQRDPFLSSESKASGLPSLLDADVSEDEVLTQVRGAAPPVKSPVTPPVMPSPSLTDKPKSEQPPKPEEAHSSKKTMLVVAGVLLGLGVLAGGGIWMMDMWKQSPPSTPAAADQKGVATPPAGTAPAAMNTEIKLSAMDHDMIAASKLEVYKMPDDQSKVFFEVKTDETVHVTGRSEDEKWYRVESKSGKEIREGYALAKGLLTLSAWEDLKRKRAQAIKAVGEFVQLPGGTFEMGCGAWQSECRDNEKPVLMITLNAFEIGKYEVTQGQWKTVMESNPSQFVACGDECPMEQVSWDDVQEFIKKLNALGVGSYRLPTEAEWEYACRSGGKPEKYCGGNQADPVAWYDKNSAKTVYRVGKKAPNKSGIYDMSGNIWEWTCSDYVEYTDKDKKYNKCSEGGLLRAPRGGSWAGTMVGVRSSARGGIVPSMRVPFMGFRLVRSQEEMQENWFKKIWHSWFH